MDRNRPVAEIKPYTEAHARHGRSDAWTRRAQVELQLGRLDEDLELPERQTKTDKHQNPLG